MKALLLWESGRTSDDFGCGQSIESTIERLDFLVNNKRMRKTFWRDGQMIPGFHSWV